MYLLKKSYSRKTKSFLNNKSSFLLILFFHDFLPNFKDKLLVNIMFEIKLPRQELTYPSLSGMTTTLHTAPQSSETNQQTAVGLPEFSQVEFFLHTFLFKVSLKVPDMKRNIGWRVFHLFISYFRSG